MAQRWRLTSLLDLVKVGLFNHVMRFCFYLMLACQLSLTIHFYFLKEHLALLENPLYLVMALPSHCTGQVVIKVVHQLHDMSLRPDRLVSRIHKQFMSSLHESFLCDYYGFNHHYFYISPILLLDEGLWDILIKDIPKEVTSYTLNLDMLREGVTYDFRVIAVNDYGYGSPSIPSPSISG